MRGERVALQHRGLQEHGRVDELRAADDRQRLGRARLEGLVAREDADTLVAAVQATQEMFA